MKAILLILTFLTLIATGYTEKIENLPPPYNSIDVLPFDEYICIGIPKEMEFLIKKNRVKTILEVGSWLGCSARHMAVILPKEGKLYAVDHWKGSEEHQLGESAYYKALPYLYEQFLSNIIHKGLTNKIIPIRMDSLAAADYLYDLCETKSVDLVYIDASHDEDAAYLDLCVWYPFVKDHGIISGDDWLWPTVANAVYKFAAETGLRINVYGNFWYLSL